jgi:hypothetical protein|eukprot:COSAG01_NODE_3483_length_6022_cov_36.146041_5_plen_118_part_00
MYLPSEDSQVCPGSCAADWTWSHHVQALPSSLTGRLLVVHVWRQNHPTSAPSKRQVRSDITDAFFEYRHACEDALWGTFGAVEHWAKVETAHDLDRRDRLRSRLARRFPVQAFNDAR